MGYVLLIAAAICCVSGFLILQGRPVAWSGAGFSQIGKSEFRHKADRIAEIYGEGFSGGSIAGVDAARYGQIKISQDDYLLMGCANSSARRNFPDIGRDEREDQIWFAGGDDLDGSNFGNSHGSYRKDGTFQVDSFLTTLPKKQYRASPEEVAWHYVRVKQLRSQNVSQETRIATMSEEAKSQPWLSLH